MIFCRDVAIENDVERIADLLCFTNTEPVTAQMVLALEGNKHRCQIRRRKVAVTEDGMIIGYSDAVHNPGWMKKHYFFVQVAVDPAYRRMRIGTELFRTAFDFTKQHAAATWGSTVLDTCNEGWEFCRNLGFEIEYHMFESKLELNTFSGKQYEPMVKQLESNGFTFFTLADVAWNTESSEKFYQLYKALEMDTPNSAQFPDKAEFDNWIFSQDWYRPEGQIIVAKENRWVGLASLGFYTDTNTLYHNLTGVIREYRGIKLAQALKYKSIQHGRESGVSFMRTNNDSTNRSILAVNEKLGYKAEPGFYRLRLNV